MRWWDHEVWLTLVDAFGLDKPEALRSLQSKGLMDRHPEVYAAVAGGFEPPGPGGPPA